MRGKKRKRGKTEIIRNRRTSLELVSRPLKTTNYDLRTHMKPKIRKRNNLKPAEKEK